VITARSKSTSTAASSLAASLGPRGQTRVRRRAALLRAALGRSDFSQASVDRLLGLPDPRLTPAEQQALWTWRARADDPLALITRLFLLGQPVALDQARLAFSDDFDAAVRAGLLRVQGGRVEALLSLSLHEGTRIFADPARARPDRHHVLGPTRATLVLESALPPGPQGRVLELGTGAGYLAVRTADRARSMTATDVSPRALELAAVNAAVAGLPESGSGAGIEWLCGDRFAPVGRRRFDLVLGNLPFVVSPDRRFVYRDGGLGEDAFVASVVGGVGRHLVPGGLAIFLGQWVHREGEPEDERLAPWFVQAGCDALVLRLEGEPVDVYAARWSAGPGVDLSAADRLREIERWVLHLRRLRIQGVSTGLFVLRRRPAPRHFMAIDDVAPTAPVPTWAEIAARLAELDASSGG
jgi:methylase of polypeptide subunit release factors